MPCGLLILWPLAPWSLALMASCPMVPLPIEPIAYCHMAHGPCGFLLYGLNNWRSPSVLKRVKLFSSAGSSLRFLFSSSEDMLRQNRLRVYPQCPHSRPIGIYKPCTSFHSPRDQNKYSFQSVPLSKSCVVCLQPSQVRALTFNAQWSVSLRAFLSTMVLGFGFASLVES